MQDQNNEDFATSLFTFSTLYFVAEEPTYLLMGFNPISPLQNQVKSLQATVKMLESEVATSKRQNEDLYSTTMSLKEHKEDSNLEVLRLEVGLIRMTWPES